jgi:(E)-4-hydroxy-3-methylbut-2-enyl-diphosphate synthase
LNCQKLEALNFRNFKVSVKSSDVKQSIAAYRKLSQLIDYPLHLGITESGTLFPGAIKSTIGIGSLLADGIGDTLRVSLSDDIAEEIRVGWQILKSLNLLKNSVDIVSCPTCARTLINVVGISKALEKYCENIHKKLKISVLGCVVNGIGEARGADIGVFGFQKGIAKLFVRGKEEKTLPEEEVLPAVKELI